MILENLKRDANHNTNSNAVIMVNFVSFATFSYLIPCISIFASQQAHKMRPSDVLIMFSLSGLIVVCKVMSCFSLTPFRYIDSRDII